MTLRNLLLSTLTPLTAISGAARGQKGHDTTAAPGAGEGVKR